MWWCCKAAYGQHEPDCPNYETRTPMTKEEIKARLEEIESDERLSYPVATIQINAPLALVQVALATEARTLRRVLGLPLIAYYKKEKDDD